MGLGRNRKVGELVVRIVVSTEPSIQIRFYGCPLTRLIGAGSQFVFQRVNLSMHITLLFLLNDDSVLSKSLIQHPVITCSMICSVRYRLFSNLCFSFEIMYFCILRLSIVLLWAGISMRCLYYPIWKTDNCWCADDAHFHDGVKYMSCTVLPEQAAITVYMDYCHKASRSFPKMQDQKSLTLHGCSFSGWGREHVAYVEATKGS